MTVPGSSSCHLASASNHRTDGTSCCKLLAAIPLIVCSLCASAGFAIVIGQPLPVVTITEGGQVVLDGDDYSTTPWSGPQSPNRVQVLQYVPGTREGGDLYDPLTERMQRELDIDRYDITAIVNLEVTSGFIKPFVRSAVVDEQRTFTRATLVLDERGLGQATWNLSQEAAFVILDEHGVVVDVIQGRPSETDLERSFSVLRNLTRSE